MQQVYHGKVINILRGVKQGDALSCAIFILCIDPLVRNINSDPTIDKVVIKSKTTNNEVNYKAGAYADDISVICRSDVASIQGLINQYDRLTRSSGLVLNADKAEIQSIHTGKVLRYYVKYAMVCRVLALCASRLIE